MRTMTDWMMPPLNNADDPHHCWYCRGTMNDDRVVLVHEPGEYQRYDFAHRECHEICVQTPQFELGKVRSDTLYAKGEDGSVYRYNGYIASDDIEQELMQLMALRYIKRHEWTLVRKAELSTS